MKTRTLRDLFIDELEDMYSSEHQIIEALPNLIRLASSEDLQKGLSNHLEETRNQVTRLEEIFSILGLTPEENKCEAMAGLVKEADELTDGQPRSAVLDAAIISAAQKIEHYEMASYGTLRNIAKSLDLEDEISDLLQETLDEEGTADKKLTKIADGTMFSDGVNEAAAESSQDQLSRR